jgi:hypothetical protein
MHQYPLNQLAFRAEIKVVLFEESSKPTLCYPTPLRGKIGRGQRKVGLQRKPQDSAPQVSIILFNDETPIAVLCASSSANWAMGAGAGLVHINSNIPLFDRK